MMLASILIVEDEPAIAELLAVNIKHAGYHPVRAHDANTANVLISGALPDLIVLDWMLTGTSGLAYLRRLRADFRTREVPVIMLTARTPEEDSVDVLYAGADDYVSKPFSPKELVARIDVVLRRRAPQFTDIAVTVNGLTLNPATHRVHVEENGVNLPIRLGPTEFKLLHFFLTHAEQVHSRAFVLQQLWDDQSYIGERTVDAHIKRLRAALKSVSREAIIETVRGRGYRLTALTQYHGLESAAQARRSSRRISLRFRRMDFRTSGCHEGHQT